MFRDVHEGPDASGFADLIHQKLHGAAYRHHFGRHFGRRGGRGFGRGFGRGAVRFEILAVLAGQPRHGYDVMLELEKQHGFRPSPGSVYPALAMLEDAGQIAGREVEGKRVFEITDAGRTALAEHKERGGFERDSDDESARDLFVGGAQSLRGLVEAAKQVARLGNPKALKEATEILDRARRDIYKLLAEAD